MRVISGDAKGVGAFTARAFLKTLSGFYVAGLKTKKLARNLGVTRQERVTEGDRDHQVVVPAHSGRGGDADCPVVAAPGWS